jgi:hypothetical protein
LAIWFQFEFSRRFIAKKKTKRGGSRPGSGRKPANPEGLVKTIAVGVPELIIESLDELAKRKGWSRSKTVVEAIRGLLAKNGSERSG